MKRFFCVLCACAMLFLAGCERHTREYLYAMDTSMDLQVWGVDSKDALRAIKALILEMDNTWSAHDEVSPLRLGELEEDPLLQKVLELKNRTGGAFDPQMYALAKLWDFDGWEHRVPEQEEIDRAKADPQWDLGGALKGHTGQLAVEQLASMDVEWALLNLGGNVQTYGMKSETEPWRIGIQNPDGGSYLCMVAVRGTASVVTSGDYQRYFELAGTRYHHILDPKTGKPADSGLRSVTVICRDGLTADALSTALFVMGLEKGSEFWRQSDDFEAVFVTTEGKIYATEGAAVSECEYEVIRREN